MEVDVLEYSFADAVDCTKCTALRLIDLKGMPQPVSATRETGPQISDAWSKGMCGYTAAVTSSDALLHSPESAAMLCSAVNCCTSIT
jgi:hypothetical protein